MYADDRVIVVAGHREELHGALEEWKNLRTHVYSFRAWATDESSPLGPVLSAVTILIEVSLCVTNPNVFVLFLVQLALDLYWSTKYWC